MAVSEKVQKKWDYLTDRATTQEVAELFVDYLEGWRGDLLQQYLWDYGWGVRQ